MATRTPTVIQPGQQDLDHSTLYSWSGLLNGDDGEPMSRTDFPDRTVQILGTFGAGGSVSIEGSNNGSDWVVLTDPQGNSISKTTGSMEMVAETPRYIRPRVTAGDGTTDITVIVFARTPR